MRCTKANPSAFPPVELLGLLASELKGAPAVDLRIEHFQCPAAGVDLVVMGEIGEAFGTRNSSSFHDPRRIFTLPHGTAN